MTDITLERTDVDNSGLMADLANDRILIVRPGKYQLTGHILWGSTGAAIPRIIGQITNSNTATAITAHEMSAFASSMYPSCQPIALSELITTSTIKIQGYRSTSTSTVYGISSGDTTMIMAVEQASW